jgi:uncharacterized membrane protein YccC
LEPVAVIALVVVLLVAASILGLRRRPRQDDGMQTFRRHIDALSPEARREVMDRARRHEANRVDGVMRGPDAQAAGSAGNAADGGRTAAPGDGTAGNG